MLDHPAYYLNPRNPYIASDYYTWAQEQSLMSMHIEDHATRFAFEREWMTEYISQGRELPPCTMDKPTYCLNLQNPEIRSAYDAYGIAAGIPQGRPLTERQRRDFEHAWMVDKLAHMSTHAAARPAQ